MKHTNAKRGPDGRFGGSDGPKAKRIEVWLQPQTVELLDTLCKQWNVGRGKVIDQLVTRGPVPPAAWTQVESKPEPTPSAPTPEPTPEPIPSAPAPTAKFNLGDRVRIIDGSNKGGYFVVGSVFWSEAETTHRYVPHGSGGVGSGYHQDVLELDPTPSDQVQSAVDGLNEVTRKANEQAAKDKAEAQRLGVSYSDLMWATRQLNIDRNYPLGADAAQAVQEKVERSQRMDNGRSIARAARRDFIKKLSKDSINELYRLTQQVDSKVDARKVARYLMDGYDDLGQGLQEDLPWVLESSSKS